MKYIFFTFLLFEVSIYSQYYPINTVEFGYMHRSHYKQTRENPLIMNSDGTITVIGEFNDYERRASANIVVPARMNLSIIDMLRMKNSNEEKKIRFGDLFGLLPIYAGTAKVTEADLTSKEINFGTGFSMGAFVMYHIKPEMGLGFSYKWDVSLDAINDRKSYYSYYVPLNYLSILMHYQRFSLELSTTLDPRPTEQDMIEKNNTRLEKKKHDKVGEYYHGNGQALDFKFYINSKLYLTVKYERLKGEWYMGSQDASLPPLSDFSTSYPYKNFELFRRDRFRTFQSGLGICF